MFTFDSWVGVAVGSGWQSYVAYINLGCYYCIGVPLGFLMGWVFKFGVMVDSQYSLIILFKSFIYEIIENNGLWFYLFVGYLGWYDVWRNLSSDNDFMFYHDEVWLGKRGKPFLLHVFSIFLGQNMCSVCVICLQKPSLLMMFFFCCKICRRR